MSKRNKSSKENDNEAMSHLKEKTLHAIVAVTLFVIAIYFVLSAISLAGRAGIDTYIIFSQLLVSDIISYLSFLLF